MPSLCHTSSIKTLSVSKCVVKWDVAMLQQCCKSSLRIVRVTSDTQTGTLGRRLFDHDVFWKQKILKIFHKGTNNIHKFEDRFLKGQVSLNGFKVFIFFIGPWAKKNENLLFSENVVIGHSSQFQVSPQFECPHFNISDVKCVWY